ncbi:MAG: glycosyl transferase family 2 [Bacteroidetes bacterium]|nr:MAG: glycosyl transferase family 2 [Bacteroidota bacterium]PTM12606.1 MAG: glycosyl transferase family 2 [Bacteroidota bacterium]
MTALLTLTGGCVIFYLGWGVVYQLGYAIAGRCWQAHEWPRASEFRRIAVFIPGYREDAVIVDTARSALLVDYPTDKYEVIVIADSFAASTLAALRALPVRVEEVAFDQSTKARALNACLNRMLGEDFAIAVVLDADNTMDAGFLQLVNKAFNQGVRVFQGRRVAKNSDTPMAVLDGLSEDVNNHILGLGHMALGVSGRLVGSGMAFSYPLFRDTMTQIDAIGGFDKELELRLTRAGERIYYDPAAIVLDEKIRKGDHLTRQRSRWIAAQFHYAAQFLPGAVVRLLRYGQWDHFNKAAQMLLPPRLLTPGFLALGTLFFALLGMGPMSLVWATVLVLNLLIFLLALPAYAWRSPYRDALLQVPVAFWHAARALPGLRKANQQFIHTPHGEGE